MRNDFEDLTLHQKYAIMYSNMRKSAKDIKTRAFLKRRMRAEKRICQEMTMRLGSCKEYRG